MNALSRAAGVVLAIAGALALARGSTAPLALAHAPDALVRLSWGARPERIETCKAQSNEELAKLSPQMRQRLICEGTTARYRLELRRDGALVATADVRGGGFRRDRELYVFREFPIPAGRSAITVRFTRIDTVAVASALERERTDTVPAAISPERALRETDELRRRREQAIPAALALDTTVTLGAHEVLLITYNSDDRRLRGIQRIP